MIDRYLESQANCPALIWVSNMVNQQITWTLREVYENVCRMSILLKQYDVKKGHRVIIYMPMIPEALFATWACNRLGAVHSIVFGGFSAKELGGRIVDSDPTAIVTASCGL
jgi:propionyl-CoA synthetase